MKTPLRHILRGSEYLRLRRLGRMSIEGVKPGLLALVLVAACPTAARAAPPETPEVAAPSSEWVVFDSGDREPVPQQPEPPEVAKQIVGESLRDYLDDRSFLMGIVVLSFGLLVLIAQAMVMFKSRSPAADPMRHMIVLTVVIAALFTVVTGISSTAVAPAMGLFGTIVGYLLGSSAKQANELAPPTPGGADKDEGKGRDQ